MAALPLDRLLTETDGPFTKRDGQNTRPRDVRALVSALATVRQGSPAAMAAQIASNLKALVEVSSP